ncbi:hypothetical protein [Argonema antarcticum]|uniref:hypothetical protein n=1 Tax=Argonema antarcticum TaxID=2942763 RepID=UPI0020119986|nr:hypothetical protein [Argonema antarcticum]MCL1473143.1 hypothetical protein [Argonema antarcticum A004/B2]
MYTQGTLRRYTAKEKNFNETVSSHSKLDGAKPDGVSTADAVAFYVPIALIVGCGVLFFMLFKKWTAIKHEIAFNVKPYHQIPCRKCRFFSGNHYLKCAIQPSVALTEQAIHCSDYCPQDDEG